MEIFLMVQKSNKKRPGNYELVCAGLAFAVANHSNVFSTHWRPQKVLDHAHVWHQSNGEYHSKVPSDAPAHPGISCAHQSTIGYLWVINSTEILSNYVSPAWKLDKPYYHKDSTSVYDDCYC